MTLSAPLPVNDYTDNARDMLRDRPPATLRAIDVSLAALARRCGHGWAGYARMAAVARAAIDAALARVPDRSCHGI